MSRLWPDSFVEDKRKLQYLNLATIVDRLYREPVHIETVLQSGAIDSSQTL